MPCHDDFVTWELASSPKADVVATVRVRDNPASWDRDGHATTVCHRTGHKADRKGCMNP